MKAIDRAIRIMDEDIVPTNKLRKIKLLSTGETTEAYITHVIGNYVYYTTKRGGTGKTTKNNIKVLDSRANDAAEVHYLFYRDIDGSVRVEKFGSIGSMRSRSDKLKQHDITKIKEWTHAEWAKEDFDKIYNKMKSSV